MDCHLVSYRYTNWLQIAAILKKPSMTWWTTRNIKGVTPHWVLLFLFYPKFQKQVKLVASKICPVHAFPWPGQEITTKLILLGSSYIHELLRSVCILTLLKMLIGYTRLILWPLFEFFKHFLFGDQLVGGGLRLLPLPHVDREFIFMKKSSLDF